MSQIVLFIASISSQLFYYERISLEETGALAPAVCSCLSLWGEDEINEREKQERELGGYGCGKVGTFYIFNVKLNCTYEIIGLLCR